MKVACPSCPAQYDIDEGRLPPSGVKLKCPKCQTVFPVMPSGAAVPLPGGPPAAGSRAAAPGPGPRAAAPGAQTGKGAVPLPSGAPSAGPRAAAPGAFEDSGAVPLPGGAPAAGPRAAAPGAFEDSGAVPLPSGAPSAGPRAAAPRAFEDGGAVPLPGGAPSAGPRAAAPGAFEDSGAVPLPGGAPAGQGFTGTPSRPPGVFEHGSADVPLPGHAPPQRAPAPAPAALPFTPEPEPGADWLSSEQEDQASVFGEESGFDDFGNVDLGSSEQALADSHDGPVAFGGATDEGFDPFGGVGSDRAEQPFGAADGDFDPFAALGDASETSSDSESPSLEQYEGSSGLDDGLSFDPSETSAAGAADELDSDSFGEAPDQDFELDIGGSSPLPMPSPAPTPDEAESDLEILDFIDEQYDAAKADGARVRDAGPTRYKVKRKSGKVFGPFEADVVVGMLKEGQLLGNEEISTDASVWKAMGSVPAFAEAIQALMEASATPGDDARPVLPAAQDDEEEEAREVSRRGKGYGVFGMSPHAAAPKAPQKADKAKAAILPHVLNRWPLVAGLLGLAVLLSAGVYLGFTPHGWFGHKLLLGPGGSKGVEGLLADAREGLGRGGYSGYRAALTATQRAMALNERDQDSRWLFAQAAFHLERRYGGFESDANRAAEFLREVATPPDTSEHAKAAMSRALKDGGERAHRSTLQRVLERDPRDSEARYLLGKSYFREANLEEASTLLEALLAEQPSSAKVLQALGRLYGLAEGAGHLESAQTYFSRALEVDETFLEAALDMAELQLESDEASLANAEATLSFIREESIDGLAPRDQARFFALRGVLAVHRREIAAAKDAFERSIAVRDTTLGRAEYGRLLLRTGELDGAIEHLAAASQLEPADVGLASDHIEALIRAGRVLDATRTLRELEGRARGDARLPFLQGLFARSQGEAAEAERHLRASLAIDPTFHRSALILGRLYMEAGRPRRAEEPLKAAVQVAPRAPEVHIGMGDYLLEVGRSDEALRSFDSALTLNSESVTGIVGRARALAILGRDDEARAGFDRAFELEPEQWELAFHRGCFLASRGDRTGALEDLRRAHQLNENDIPTRVRLGAVLYELGRLEEAGRHLQAAATLPNAPAEAFYYLGLVLARQGDRRAGLDRLRRAIAAETTQPRYYFAMGTIHEEGREYNDALFNYQKAIDLDPKYVEAWGRMGDVHAVMNRYREAVAAYQRAHRLAPEQADIAIRLGDTFVRWGRPQDAVEWYDRALRLEPGVDDLHVRLARALQSSGNHQRAVTVFQQALRHSPGDPTPHYFLGYAFKDRGDYRQAVRYFRSFLEHAPEDHPHRREVEDEIIDLRR